MQRYREDRGKESERKRWKGRRRAEAGCKEEKVSKKVAEGSPPSG